MNRVCAPRAAPTAVAASPGPNCISSGMRPKGPVSNRGFAPNHGNTRSWEANASSITQSLLPVARMPVTDHVSVMRTWSIGITPAMNSRRRRR